MFYFLLCRYILFRDGDSNTSISKYVLKDHFINKKQYQRPRSVSGTRDTWYWLFESKNISEVVVCNVEVWSPTPSINTALTALFAESNIKL